MEHGLAVDPKTGRPIDYAAKRAEREMATRTKLEADALNGIEAERRLQTEDGKYFINVFLRMLTSRIDQLVKADPQCITLISSLDELGMKISAGRMAAEKLTSMKLRVSNINPLINEEEEVAPM